MATKNGNYIATNNGKVYRYGKRKDMATNNGKSYSYEKKEMYTSTNKWTILQLRKTENDLAATKKNETLYGNENVKVYS